MPARKEKPNAPNPAKNSDRGSRDVVDGPIPAGQIHAIKGDKMFDQYVEPTWMVARYWYGWFSIAAALMSAAFLTWLLRRLWVIHIDRKGDK